MQKGKKMLTCIWGFWYIEKKYWVLKHYVFKGCIVIIVFWMKEFYLNNMLLKSHDQEAIQANCLIFS